MVRSPAPPVPAAARGSAHAVAGVGCGSYLAGGSPPAGDPQEQRPVEPDSVYALKILKNGDNRALQQQQRARSPSRSEEATPLGGRRRQRKKARRSGATVRAASRREGEKARRRRRRSRRSRPSRPPRSPPSGVDLAASRCVETKWAQTLRSDREISTEQWQRLIYIGFSSICHI